VVYDDGSGNEVEETFTVDSSFSPGDTVELSNATQSTLIRVERDIENNWDGDIATAIPSGTTISASAYRTARMVYKSDNDEIVRIELGGDIELLEVLVEDRSEVVYTSWVNVTSDPAVSKEEMDKLMNAQQKTIEQLSTINNKGIVGLLFGNSGIPPWVIGGGVVVIIAWFLTQQDD